jgi:hypothetical protein
MSDKPACRKFGSVAYGVAFAFIAVGVALFQAVFRDRMPPLYFGDGWFDWGSAFWSAAFGGFAGLIGGVLGYLVERRLRA